MVRAGAFLATLLVAVTVTATGCCRSDCEGNTECSLLPFTSAVCPPSDLSGDGEGEGEAVVGEGEGEAVAGEGEGESVGEGEGESVAGEGEGEAVPDRPVGQCGVNADCDSGTCNRGLPGGSCSCASDGDCNANSSCSDFGVCIGDCAADDDCPAGLRCLTGSGRCAAVPCDDDGDCDARFVCDFDFGTPQCARATCAGGESCPVGTGCVDGVCLE